MSTSCSPTYATRSSTASRRRIGSRRSGSRSTATPFDPRPPAVSPGCASAAGAATRGLGVDDFREIGRVIGEALTRDFGDEHRAELTERTRALAERYPLYPQLAPQPV